jgi:hypothetical protein
MKKNAHGTIIRSKYASHIILCLHPQTVCRSLFPRDTNAFAKPRVHSFQSTVPNRFSPHEHFPSPSSDAGDASDDGLMYYPDSASVRVRPSGRYIHSHIYHKTLHGPKADPIELNLWTMIPMSKTTRAMLDPEAEEVDGQTDAEGLCPSPPGAQPHPHTHPHPHPQHPQR